MKHISQRFVAYYRVSTARQGKSGLGLQAQRDAVEGYVSRVGGEIVAEHVEIESGKLNDRPELQAALEATQWRQATLIIAKLDRLSRNAAFLMNLRDSGTPFVAADMPEANTLTVGVLAVIAQHEREMISRRTKESLAAAKGRGQLLGFSNPRLRDNARCCSEKGRAKASAAAAARHKHLADQRAKSLQSVVRRLREEGVTGTRQMAKALNELGARSPRGKEWQSGTVSRLLGRLERLSD